ncbi:unnamed protein product, partial [Sphagnum compactum]
INNAAILLIGKDTTFETVKPVFDTNYFGVKNVTKALLPLLRDDTPGGARVIVVASRAGQLKSLESKDYVKTFSDREHLTEEAVDNFANHYLKDIANGSLKEGDWVDISSHPGPNWGWPFETYAVSKVAVIAFVSVLHNTFFSQPGSGKKIDIFSCCPGYVATSVNTSGGNSVEVGADTPVWLALHSPEGGSGKFWAEREPSSFLFVAAQEGAKKKATIAKLPSLSSSFVLLWWSKDTVAVVTGANKGIGFEIVRQLAKEGITVVLTARDATRGEEALESLKSQGLHNVNFHLLDVTSQESILALANWLRETYGGIDILINNAAILLIGKDTTFETVKPVFDTNYFGVKNVTKALLPLLRDDTPGGARVIVVASRAGQLKSLESKDYVKTFSDREHLTEEAVDNFANHYLKDIANGSLKEGDWVDISSRPGPNWGWPFETYAVSKVAVIAFVSVLHNTFFSKPGSGKKINIFSCCPGYVATSVNTSGGNSVEVDDIARFGYRLNMKVEKKTGSFLILGYLVELIIKI